ncbi:MAG: hypothetical protein J2P31_15680 [Blastocatellia bacterium]|nr:hypothetical protein [Blastocatellia bacterium]
MLLFLCLTVTLQSKGPQLDYDKLKDETLASTPTIDVKLKKEDYVTKGLEFKIQYTYQGMRQRPKTAKLIFRTYSHRWRFLEEENRTGVLFFQGQRIDLPPTPAYTSVVGKKFLEETLIYQIDFTDLEKLLSSPYVDLQIGIIEGRINDKQLGKTREVLTGLLAGNTK